jgi:hypothetical protein
MAGSSGALFAAVAGLVLSVALGAADPASDPGGGASGGERDAASGLVAAGAPTAGVGDGDGDGTGSTETIATSPDSLGESPPGLGKRLLIAAALAAGITCSVGACDAGDVAPAAADAGSCVGSTGGKTGCGEPLLVPLAAVSGVLFGSAGGLVVATVPDGGHANTQAREVDIAAAESGLAVGR